jgi:hypothetical protein
MAKDKDVERFKKDLRSFGKSAAGHVPGLGQALGIYDTYQTGSKLAKSTRKVVGKRVRREKSKINRRIRKISRYL